MRYISVCSGIEAASLAWEPLGWEPLAFSEIEPFPCKVLAHRWPTVPNLGDMTQFLNWPMSILAECDLIIGGCPCQAFSVAGQRLSLSDARGNLTLVYAQLINHIDEIRRLYGRPPIIIVYENVPGILSTKDNAFGCFLATLVGEEVPLEPPGGRWTNSGYVFGPQRTACWRILDAQYFGVAQRRRRVFVVASAGAVRVEQILFESEGVRRDTPPSRETGQEIAGTLGSRSTGGGFPGSDEAMSDYVQPVNTTGAGFWREGFGTLRAREQESHEHLICMSTGQAGAEIGIGVGTTLNCNHEAPIVTTQYGEVAGSQTARHNSSPCADRGMNVVAFHAEAQPDQMNSSNETTTSQHAAIAYGWQVRRLTPLECERLQGMADDHTLIPGAKDGPRYKAIGNSMAVPVVKWLGQRIDRYYNRR